MTALQFITKVYEIVCIYISIYSLNRTCMLAEQSEKTNNSLEEVETKMQTKRMQESRTFKAA